MSMREVSDKCQGAVCRIWDKCGGWAWCEGIGKGTRFDSRDWDFERSDQDPAPISDKGPRRREEGVGDRDGNLERHDQVPTGVGRGEGGGGGNDFGQVRGLGLV